MNPVDKVTEATETPVAVIILAAGLGTRMKSDRAKVLHEIDGRPMIRYVVETAQALNTKETIVVVGHQRSRVKAALSDFPRLKFAPQNEQLGTGHAVQCALPEVIETIDHVVVLCGDVPLLKASTVARLMHDHYHSGCVVTILAMNVENPTGYGRIVVDSNGDVDRIVEEADADDQQKKIQTINAGIYCIEKKFLNSAINSLSTNNAQNEFYLTDIVAIARAHSCRAGIVMGDDPIEVIGVNTLAELKTVDGVMQSRKSKIS